MKWLVPVCRVVITAVFLCAGIAKALDPHQFAVQIHAFRITPWTLSAAIALWLPFAEIAAGLSLWVRRWSGGGWVLAGGMLVVFLFALASALVRGFDIDCGCFGAGGGESPIGWAIARNSLLLAAVTIGILHQKSHNA